MLKFFEKLAIFVKEIEGSAIGNKFNGTQIFADEPR